MCFADFARHSPIVQVVKLSAQYAHPDHHGIQYRHQPQLIITMCAIIFPRGLPECTSTGHLWMSFMGCGMMFEHDTIYRVRSRCDPVYRNIHLVERSRATSPIRNTVRPLRNTSVTIFMICASSTHVSLMLREL
jgi:hypothetical protein